MLQNPLNETELVGHDDEDIGIDIVDENKNKHRVQVGWDGEVTFHGTDEYPHKREDRTQEEQRIMSQVEARAKYAAQQEFPEAGILHPGWIPAHIERGIEALRKLQLDDFQREFRDFYEALADPTEYATDPPDDVTVESVRIYKAFTITSDDRIDEIDDVSLSYKRTDGSDCVVGRIRDDTDDSLVVCVMPPLNFADDFDYHDQFHEIVVGHLAAQIRDIYLHMGEVPPDQYKVEGIGKLDIHGDGVGDS